MDRNQSARPVSCGRRSSIQDVRRELVGDVGAPMAGEANPDGIQRLLAAADWDADAA
ncbi:MAG: hypothetical protein ABI232_03445 [Jatrophihabitantaceae bacterium]